MERIMQRAQREAVFKLILSHEHNMAILDAIGLTDSADILRISWLDLSRRLHDISPAELEALASRVEATSPANDVVPGVSLHRLMVPSVDGSPRAPSTVVRRRRMGRR
jgi:hypothetical protein